MYFTYLIEMSFKTILMNLSVALLYRCILLQILRNIFNSLCCYRKYILNSIGCLVYSNCSVYLFNYTFGDFRYHSQLIHISKVTVACIKHLLQFLEVKLLFRVYIYLEVDIKNIMLIFVLCLLIQFLKYILLVRYFF